MARSKTGTGSYPGLGKKVGGSNLRQTSKGAPTKLSAPAPPMGGARRLSHAQGMRVAK